jgi:hypothetical protein
MRPLSIIVGLLLIGVAVYAFSDPMSRSRNWVAAEEWENRPEQAKAKQQKYTSAMSILVAGFGLFFVVLGLFTG